jgi:hypothetical protein
VSLENPTKPLGSCTSHCNIVSSGAKVLRTMTTEFLSQPPPCTKRNEARSISAGSSIVKTAGSVQEEAGSGAPLVRGEGLRLSIELLVRGAWPSLGLPFA